MYCFLSLYKRERIVSVTEEQAIVSANYTLPIHQRILKNIYTTGFTKILSSANVFM